MLQKWKLIINNWINCYSDDTTEGVRNVNIDSLLTIISHLRENLNLDESKSSVLEALTVEEFILEKYPGFKFKNGTVKASNEDDIYLGASLLLFFVCVNSKNVDIKSVMCNKLSGDDQEIIMKFSKALMECSLITCDDIQTAITEACGIDMTTIDIGQAKVAVAETPPALRSLHGEVRRLQAALDAECFDRNFLQEELTRTNFRLEKLVKDKEQYKLEIMDLKAKISLCCRGDHDSEHMENDEKHSTKLARQLQDMEERLIKVQDQLEETVYENESLKAKLEGLKEDRDKWLALSQHESARAAQLAEELETERRQMQSLRELVTELRQHNRLNRFDSSLLECDDPDASIQSLGHNLSICSEACVNVIEVQLSEERAKVDALKLQIETLQKENEQLHFAIEEDNSNHELILKEKDGIIDNLEQQLREQKTLLESLRKDHEDITLSWEKHKLKTREIIEVQDERIRKLNDHLGSLKQEFTDLKNVNDELTNKVDVIQKEAADSERTYKDEIESVVQLLTQEKTKNDIITNEMQMLQNRLSEQTSAIDILTTDKNKLEETYEVVLAKNTEISDDKMILAHQLAEEKSLRQILEEEKKALSTQNAVNEKKYSKQIKQIEKKLSKEVGKTKAIIQDKECLAQQLIEQKSAKELADKEKENILLEKSVVEQNLNKLNIELSEQINQLINKQTSLEQQCSAEKAIAEVLNEEKKLLIKTLEEEKLSNEVLLKDKECLVTENNSLKHDILEQKTAQEVLLNDMQLLMVQKEDFVKSLEFEKSVRDEIENEKNGLRKELKEVEEQYTCELKSKEVELENVAEDIKRLHIKLEDQRELNKQITVVLNVGLEKLIEGINQEKFTSNILQNVINCNDTISTVDKCDLLINIANTLNTIVITKMKALQVNNSTLKSLKEVSKQSESEICKLQTVITETNNELSKQNETYTNTLDSQLKEIKTLQQENQNLTNELNTLKIQLEVKVHSLKEKLVEQENATDDLKKGYECQIDNLNIMIITNLNKYLKDKTLALELTVNEKNQLKQIVAENDKVINCLKEELETMTQNLERVTSEFESEKLVLENMATVTESVMEDQKVAFNETIAELSNAHKLLQDANATIKDQLENERREFELKIQEKETALELKHLELIELQHLKEDVEEGKILQQKTSDKEITALKNDILKKENEMVKLKEELHEINEIKSQKSVLDEEIIVIKADIKSKEEEVEKMLQEKNILQNVIRNYEEDVVSLQKQNTDLKIKIDSLEREYHNKVDTLTDSLKEEFAYKKDLNAKLTEKVETLLVMENKIKYLEDELNTLKREKSEVEDSYLAKIGELQTLLQINSLTNDEEIKKLKEYSMELEQQSFELNRDKTALKENINTLNKNNMDLEENIGQERRIKEELEQYICELRKSIANFQENISVLNDANTELKKEKDKLEQYILKLEKSIAVLKEDVTDLINANTELEQDRLKLKLHGTELKESANNLKLFNTELAEEFNKLKKEHDELADRFSKEKTAKEEHNKQISNTLCMGLTKLIQDLKKEGIANETLQQLFDVEKDDISVIDKCDMLINIANMVTAEVVMRKNLEKALEHEDAALAELKQVVQQKEVQIFELQSEIKRLKQVVNETKIEMSKQNAMHTTTLDNKSREMQLLQQENTSLTNDLTDVKIQLEVKVHSLKEKLIDSENLTDKLKKSYECQIENLNIMITKLTNYLKDKTLELEVARKEKERLQQIIEVNNKAIKSLEEEVKSEKLRQEKLMTDFESERMVIKNMVTVTESVMEDQKTTFNTTVLEKEKAIELLQEEISNQKRAFELKLKEKDTAIELAQKELVELRLVKGSLEAEITLQKETLDSEMNLLKIDIQKKEGEVMKLDEQNKQLEIMNKNYKDSAETLADQNSELKIMKDAMEVELRDKVEKLTESLQEQIDNKKDLNIELNEKSTTVFELEEKIKRFEEKINILELEKSNLIIEKDDHLVKMKEFETNSLKDAEEIAKLLKDKADLSEENDELKKVCKETKEEINVLKKVIAELKDELDKLQQSNAQLLDDIHELNTKNMKSAEEVSKLKISNTELIDAIEGNKAEIKKLEEAIKHEQDQYNKLQDDLNNEKVTLVNKCDILQDYHTKAEKELEERQKEIVSLQKEVQTLQAKVEMCVTESVAKDGHISKMSKEKDVVINIVNQELLQEKVLRAKYQKDLEEKIATISELKKNFNELNNEREALKILKKENEELIKAIGLRETFALRSHESTSSRKYSGPIAEKELRDIHHQVDNTSDITHSSIESLKTITDLEKIIHDKNRTITTLQSDVSYLKTLMAESENKLLDVTKELEVTKENCQQLSSQLKKIVHQKNEEIAELKKHVSKMSVTENRATQIIKVSAKYQAIILKRIAEIKSNTVLKELTNFGNSNNNCDSELRRSLSAGSITMEDLENFLETTERHLKKCSEKQMALQKEKDRLTEVNRINESEIINLKKFLTELSVSFQTFSSVKDLYAQKLSRVISMQRTVRREILNLDGHVTDTCMLKLERGYAAVMQDLAECAMNLERWVERCIGRTLSTEKLKQAFLNDSERTSLAPSTVQNAGLEVQLDELENSFQKLLEEVSRAPKGEGARDAQAVTLMEVRAEYEDKLNRMKAKMKQLYTEQIAVFKEKQKEEIALLERELARARYTLSQSSRAYEDHIKGLTSELWSVGEKFLMQKDEAKYLRRKQQSGSLMSLQHVHSSGLVPPQEEPRHSVDTQSLRSLPTSNNGGTKREGRGLHMSDEEGEVFDNRYLQELSTPGRAGLRPGAPAPPERLSELRWRNSLCPPHLKSSYPAETQFAHAVDEEEIKATGGPGAGRPQRKEVGIIAYKKPGPPTPSKQAGRLSATDSELRESLRVEADPQPSRKTSTPSRIRSLFRSSKADNTEGTPRSRRLSNIFRKK